MKDVTVYGEDGVQPTQNSNIPFHADVFCKSTQKSTLKTMNHPLAYFFSLKQQHTHTSIRNPF